MVTNQILQDKNILIRELNKYGGYPSQKTKGFYNCIHCNSSDGLKIGQDNGNWVYHCFSCKEGGNAFTPGIEVGGKSFKETVDEICLDNGLSSPFKSYSEEDIKKYKAEKYKKYAQTKVNEFKEDKEKHLKALQELHILNKEYDKCMDLEDMLDKLNVYSTEYINYSKYNATNIYTYSKYISEAPEGYTMALNKAREGYKVLLLAPTGGGKTESIVNLAKELELNALFISPNASNVEQIINKYEIDGAFGTDRSAKKTFECEGIKAMTWDKVQSLADVDFSNTVAIRDEIHQTLIDSYRHSKIQGVYENTSKCKGVLDITATPNKLDIEYYDYVIQYISDKQTDYKVNLYNEISDIEILKIINKSKKFAMLRNDKKYLDFCASRTSKKTDVVHTDSKGTSKLYDSIVTNESMGDYEGLFNTSTIVAGVNIYDKDVTDIIIVGIKDIATIRQYVARFRDLETVNVHIFNTYKDFSKTFSIEWQISKGIEEVDAWVDYCNAGLKLKNDITKIHLQPISLNGEASLYFDKNEGIYKADYITLRVNSYRAYYNNSDIVSFRELLGEYFNDICLMYIEANDDEGKKEYKELIKGQESAILNVLSQYKKELVGANEILSGNPSKVLQEHMLENILNESKLIDLYEAIRLRELLNVGNVGEYISIFSDLVLKNNMTVDLAWAMASLCTKTRKRVYRMLYNINYNRFKEEYPNQIDDSRIESKIYNFITSKFAVGSSYISESMEGFMADFNSHFKELNGLITERFIKNTLKEIYSIDSTQTRSVTHQNTIIYINNVEKICDSKKVLRVYSINKPIELVDIVAQYEALEGLEADLYQYLDYRYSQMKKEADNIEISILDDKVIKSLIKQGKFTEVDMCHNPFI